MYTGKPVILFDGVCNLCNSAVRFVIKHDKKGMFRFAALQSPAGERFAQQYGIPPAYNSVVLISSGRAFLKSAAALRIARRLGGLWPLLYVFIAVPAPIRDRIYDFVARNRYRWFGRADHCLRPTPGLQEKFIG
ncbi:thiol-disulfide oxidoreductase DCC family protein [Niabella aurantiaca]|uniref:thiol-disulfide oxidoreductase DCC family protein n=1 Tax=Niabella aurantiaca TaxID=379900 RepID=UPI0003688014|nr:thiol-disulfide oxidoreductase DCC family protein [Niabella aurantiaca]